MDVDLKTLIGVTYLIPIAITLKKIYAPNFELPEPIACALARIDVGGPGNPLAADPRHHVLVDRVDRA